MAKVRSSAISRTHDRVASLVRTSSDDRYLAAHEIEHALLAGDTARALATATNFERCMARLAILGGAFARVLAREVEALLRLEASGGEVLRAWSGFYRDHLHQIARADDTWGAPQIFLQVAIEHADDSPVTAGAERWIEEGRCDWLWLRRRARPARVTRNPLLRVFEGHARGVTAVHLLSGERLLSTSRDGTLRLWSLATGVCHGVMEGHARGDVFARLLPGDRCLTWGQDGTVRLWDLATRCCVAVLARHDSAVAGVVLLSGQGYVSWTRDGAMCHGTLDRGGASEIDLGLTSIVAQVALGDGSQLLLGGGGELVRCSHVGGRLLATPVARDVQVLVDLPPDRVGVCRLASGGFRLDILDRLDGRLLSRHEGTDLLAERNEPAPDDAAPASGNRFEGACTSTNAPFAATEAALASDFGEGAEDLGTNLLDWPEAIDARAVPDAGCVAEQDRLASLVDDLLGEMFGPTKVCRVVALPRERVLLVGTGGRYTALDLREMTVLRLESQGNRPFVDAFGLTNGAILFQEEPDRETARTTERWRCLEPETGAPMTLFEPRRFAKLHDLGGGRVATTTAKGEMEIWEVGGGKRVGGVLAHARSIDGVALLRGERLLTWSDDGTIRLWDLGSLSDAPSAPSSISSARWLPGSGRVIAWGEQGQVSVRAGETGAELAVIDAPARSNPPTLFAFASGRFVLSWECGTRLFDRDGACRATFGSRDAPYGDEGAVTDRGTRDQESWGDAIELRDGSVVCWSHHRSSQPLEPESKIGAARCALFHWAEDGRQLRRWAAGTDALYGLLELDDGRLLTWPSGNDILVWHLAEDAPPTRLTGHTAAPTTVVRWGRERLVSRAEDEDALLVWSARDLEWMARLAGHGDGRTGPLRMAGPVVMEDGRLVSWSASSIRVWNVDGSHSGSYDTPPIPQDVWRAICSSRGREHFPSWFALLGHQHSPRLSLQHLSSLPVHVRWESSGAVDPVGLLAEGTVIALEHGALRHLDLFLGSRRISLEDARLAIETGRAPRTNRLPT